MPVLPGEYTSGYNRLTGLEQSSLGSAQRAAALIDDDRSLFTTVPGVLGLGVVDTIDTVASSIPLLSNVIGADRGDINEAMLGALDMPGLRDFYNDYQSGIEVTSGIYGLIGSELVARRFTAPAGALMRGLQKIPYVRRVTTLDNEYRQAMQVVRSVDMQLARRGALGAEQYAGRVTLSMPEGAEALTISRAGARSRALRLGASVGVRDVARTEAVMAVALNQNGFLYDDDASTNLLWMGLGLAGGAGLEWVHGAYRLRRHVNSDEVRRAFAGALDPNGSEEARLLWKEIRSNVSPDEAATMSYAGGGWTDQVTSLLVSRKSLLDSPVSTTDNNAHQLLGNRDRLATQHLQLAHETINKVTSKGDGVNGFTRFDMKAPYYGNHANYLLSTDAGAFYLAERIAGVPDNYGILDLVNARNGRLTEQINTVQTFVDSLMKQKSKRSVKQEAALLESAEELRRLRFLRDLTPVPYIDGEAATLSDARAFDGWIEPRIDSSKIPGKDDADDAILWEARSESAAAKVGIDTDLNIYLPSNVSLDGADHYDMLRLYRSAQRMVDYFAKGANRKLVVPENANWFQLDLVEEILRRNEGVDVEWATGMTRSSAQVESFAQKVEAIRRQSRLYGPARPSRELTESDVARLIQNAPGAPKSYTKMGKRGWEDGIKAALGQKVERPSDATVQYQKAYDRGLKLGRKLVPPPRDNPTIKRNMEDITTLRTNNPKQRRAPELTEEEIVSRLRIKYNLPRLTAYERGTLGELEHPVEALMRGAGTWDGDVRSMGLSEIQEAAARYKRIGDIQPVSKDDIASLYGSSFRFMLDDLGQPIKPIIMYKRPAKAHEWAEDHIAERLATRKMVMLTKLTTATNAPLTTVTTRALVSNPDFNAASRTHELLETQIQGAFAGASPQGFWGALGKSMTTREFQDRDNPILLAATRIQKMVNNLFRGELRKLSEQTFGDTLTSLNSPRNADSRLLLHTFHSFRSGWDLAVNKKTGEVARVERTGPNGKKLHGFILDDTDANRTRWQKQFGTQMPTGQTLIAPNGKEVVLDDLGLDIQSRYNVITERILEEQNALIRAQGLKEIKSVPMYVPAPNVGGKFIGHIYDPMNKIVPNTGVIASTQEEFAKKAEEAYKQISKLGLGYTFRTQDDVKRFATIWDKAQMDMMDPGTTAIAGGKSAKGLNIGATVNMQAFDESLKVAQDRFMEHGNDIIEAMMKEQINAANARANISSPVSRNRSGFFRDQQYRSIHHVYLENLLGRSPLSSSGSLVGRLYNTVEGGIDQLLAGSRPAVVKTGTAVGAWIDRGKIWSKTDAAKKDFDSLSSSLGEFMPFENAVAYAESRGAGSLPPTAMGMAAGINKFTTGMLLRFAEVMHPIMNMSGMVNAMPAVVRHMTPRRGESIEQYSARVGHTATIFNMPDGRFVGVADMGKIAMRAFQKALKPSAVDDYDLMTRQGYLRGNVSEVMRDYASMQTRSQWQENIRKVVDKGSVLTDYSEDFSRTYGHFVGLEVGQMLGITNREALHQFAHDMANKMIANYSPHNRSEIFQGATGAVLGLFQSWVQNYYQRMFRYIETKDGRALATQFATQGSLFGIHSVPGWGEANALFSWASDGEVDITDGVYNNFGPAFGTLMANGVVGNLPTIFGADALDLTSRAGIEARLPGFNPAPSIMMAKRMMEGVGEGLSLFMGDNPALTLTQVAEVASNMMPNRPIAGMIEQFGAHGNDTDAYGQLVHDTRTWSESIYRMIGGRSERQAREVEAFYANKAQGEFQAARQDVLRVATRAAIRAQNWDALPAIFESYVTGGGDPRHFRRWLRQNYEAATTSRAQRQLEEVINDPEKMRMVARLLDAGVGVSADEATEGYDTSLRVQTELDTVVDPTIR